MHERGLQFLQVPKAYYSDLRERLNRSKLKISEDLDMVGKSMRILLLFDYNRLFIHSLKSFIFWLILTKTDIYFKFLQSQCKIDQLCFLKSFSAWTTMWVNYRENACTPNSSFLYSKYGSLTLYCRVLALETSKRCLKLSNETKKNVEISDLLHIAHLSFNFLFILSGILLCRY